MRATVRVIERQRLTEIGKGTNTWSVTDFERVSNRNSERNRGTEREKGRLREMTETDRDSHRARKTGIEIGGNGEGDGQGMRK